MQIKVEYFNICMLLSCDTFPDYVDRCPLLDDDGSYLSCIPLSDYGPSMTIQEEEELCEATDNYSIAAIKVCMSTS